MKNRFNWAFELLETKVHSARNDYERGVAPMQERATLVASLKLAIEEARSRQEEFAGQERYHHFLEEYINAVQGFVDSADDGTDLAPRLDTLTESITRLDDTIREALR